MRTAGVTQESFQPHTIVCRDADIRMKAETADRGAARPAGDPPRDRIIRGLRMEGRRRRRMQTAALVAEWALLLYKTACNRQ